MCDKSSLRKELLSKRNGFPNQLKKQADGAILKNFLSAFSGFESFFIYNSITSETDTKQIINALVNAGKRVYLPRVEGDNIVAVPYGRTSSGAYGIYEPEGQLFFGEIEITVIPLIAVNNCGYRIGYGKGYYDRYLKDRQYTKKVGLGYSFQIQDFKEDEWDVPLDLFLCEKGIYNMAEKKEERR